MKFSYLHPFLILTMIFFISCDEKLNNPQVDGGINIIIPGKSIEGIHLGDSKDIVEQKLGKPSSIGWADGVYRSWRTIIYLTGEHAYLTFYFLSDNNEYGPLDLITVSPPYKGKTKEGIGIGSKRSEVHDIYGHPKYILTNEATGWIADFYCFNGKKFELHYSDSLIAGFSMGYYLPILQDTLTICN